MYNPLAVHVQIKANPAIPLSVHFYPVIVSLISHTMNQYVKNRRQWGKTNFYVILLACILDHHGVGTEGGN
jgi:hypothetical protein